MAGILLWRSLRPLPGRTGDSRGSRWRFALQFFWKTFAPQVAARATIES